MASTVGILWHVLVSRLCSCLAQGKLEEAIVSRLVFLKGCLEGRCGTRLHEALTFPRPTGAREMWLQLSVLPPVPRRALHGAGRGARGACCPLGVCRGEACPSKYFCSGYIR